MKHVDLSNSIAAEMSRVLNSEENKQMFNSSSMLEKLAFKKVSDPDEVTEVEKELAKSLHKEASATSSCIRCYEQKPDSTGVCKCECRGPADCAKGCPCKCGGGAYAKSLKSSADVKSAVNQLLAISSQLDDMGFEKLAATSILMADRLVSEAKAKKSDKKTSKESEKSKGKKPDMKERMKKMREMQKGKKSKKSEDKKSDKKSSKTKDKK